MQLEDKDMPSKITKKNIQYKKNGTRMCPTFTSLSLYDAVLMNELAIYYLHYLQSSLDYALSINYCTCGEKSN